MLSLHQHDTSSPIAKQDERSCAKLSSRVSKKLFKDNDDWCIFQYRNTHLLFFDGTVCYLHCVPQKEGLPGRTGPDRNCRVNRHDCKYPQKEQSEMDVLTNTKGLVSAGTMCSVVQARSGLGYAVSFSSDAQRKAFKKVPRLD